MRTMGRNQMQVLRALRRHGPYPGSWGYGGYKTTEKILLSLVRRGLATKERIDDRRERFELSPKGMEFLESLCDKCRGDRVVPNSEGKMVRCRWCFGTGLRHNGVR